MELAGIMAERRCVVGPCTCWKSLAVLTSFCLRPCAVHSQECPVDDEPGFMQVWHRSSDTSATMALMSIRWSLSLRFWPVRTDLLQKRLAWLNSDFFVSAWSLCRSVLHATYLTIIRVLRPNGVARLCASEGSHDELQMN